MGRFHGLRVLGLRAGRMRDLIWVVVKIMVPFWFPIIIPDIGGTQKGIIILTTTHLGLGCPESNPELDVEL